MAKGCVILAALLVLATAAPQNRAQNEGSRLQDRLTSMEWEQLGNTIEEIFGIAPGSRREEQVADPTDAAAEQTSGERGSERRREFEDRQRSEQSGRLEDGEERNREALERAQGRLPEREARRREMSGVAEGETVRQSKVQQQLASQKDHQGKGQEGSKQKKKEHDKYYNSFPLYEFAYGVHDPATGDRKEQWEKRVGDHVRGTYTLDQPDGKTRIVEYQADDKRGFEAVVTQVERTEDSQRGNVKWGHSDREVAQSYTKLKKVD